MEYTQQIPDVQWPQDIQFSMLHSWAHAGVMTNTPAPLLAIMDNQCPCQIWGKDLS